ncbi:MAG: VCBS repeat-containing protein [Gammaproteobacteria bacterium]|nr:VCBS repeat-containing protein [Gammaproteobacteria bacterium]
MASAALPASGMAPGFPDFEADVFNLIEDADHGGPLRPRYVEAVDDPFRASSDEPPLAEWGTVRALDWNADGLFDLLVAYNLREPDELRMIVYLNHGRPGQPAFSGTLSPERSFTLRARGADAPARDRPGVFRAPGRHGDHVWIGFEPSVVDVNGDGLFDLLVYEGVMNPARGRGIWLLLNEGSAGQPALSAFYVNDAQQLARIPPAARSSAWSLLQARPGGARAGRYGSVRVLDWNSDGVADLVQQNDAGTFLARGRSVSSGDSSAPLVQRGRGAASQMLTLAPGQWDVRSDGWVAQNLADGRGFPGLSRFAAGDFDADGRNELLLAVSVVHDEHGTDGYLALYRASEAGSDVFAALEGGRFTLNEQSSFWAQLWFPRHGWWHPRAAVLDYDEDGDLDVLAGWGGGNGQRQKGEGIYLYRTPGGVPGSSPLFAP